MRKIIEEIVSGQAANQAGTASSVRRPTHNSNATIATLAHAAATGRLQPEMNTAGRYPHTMAMAAVAIAYGA